MPKKETKPAFRFPKTFTAKVTRATFKAAQRRRNAANFSVFFDCPVALAVRRALKLKRGWTSVSRVDAGVWSPKMVYQRYTHDGALLVQAFDKSTPLELPQTVKFTLAVQE